MRAVILIHKQRGHMDDLPPAFSRHNPDAGLRPFFLFHGAGRVIPHHAGEIQHILARDLFTLLLGVRFPGVMNDLD